MALNHYPQEEHRHRFLARQYCCSKQEVLCSEVASDAGRCMLMVGRSGDLRGITQPHWVALYGLLGNTRMTPYAQKRREAGRPVWADMALDGLFLLRRLTRTTCASEPTQQTASQCASYAAHARAPSLAHQRPGGTGGNGGGQGMDGICSIGHEMDFSSMIGSESYRCDARHQVDERKTKISQSRTRSVRVRSLANIAIEGQRDGFPLLPTRARARGDLPSMRETSSARPEEKVEGLGGVHFFHTTTTTTW